MSDKELRAAIGRQVMRQIDGMSAADQLVILEWLERTVSSLEAGEKNTTDINLLAGVLDGSLALEVKDGELMCRATEQGLADTLAKANSDPKIRAQLEAGLRAMGIDVSFTKGPKGKQ